MSQKKEFQAPVYSREQVMQMSPQDIQNIMERSKFPVYAALDRLSELKVSWALYSPQQKKSLLHCAAEQGDCVSIKLLLDHKIYPVDYAAPKELTALSFACKGGHFEAVQLLVQSGANVNAGVGKPYPALFGAIDSRKMEIFDYLLQCGANVYGLDESGRTCLSYATNSNKIEMMDKCVQLGLYPTNVNIIGWNLLHEACMCPRVETLNKVLGQYRLDPYAMDKLRRRPIDYLIESGDRATLDLFVSYGIDIFTARSYDGKCPLHFACEADNVETTRYFLEKGSNPNLPNPMTRVFPIQTAVEKNNVEMFDLLVSFGASTVVFIMEGDSLLTKAVKKNNVFLIERLVRTGHSVHEGGGPNKMSLLHVAALYSTPEVIHKLIDLGANINFLDDEKMSPLHRACVSNRPNAVFALIQRGADVNAAGPSGKLPLDLATDPNVIRILTENGAQNQSFMSKCFNCFGCCA